MIGPRFAVARIEACKRCVMLGPLFVVEELKKGLCCGQLLLFGRRFTVESCRNLSGSNGFCSLVRCLWMECRVRVILWAVVSV